MMRLSLSESEFKLWRIDWFYLWISLY